LHHYGSDFLAPLPYATPLSLVNQNISTTKVSSKKGEKVLDKMHTAAEPIARLEHRQQFASAE